MKKLVLCLAICLAASVIPALSLDLNSAESFVRYSAIGENIRLELSISSIVYTKDGSLSLPEQIRPYLTHKSAIPELLISVNIPAGSEYKLKTASHQIQTELSYSTEKSPGAASVSLSKAYQIRDLRGIDVLVRPVQSKDGKLLISDKITIDLIREGNLQTVEDKQPGKLNPYFADIYRQHFINFDYRYEDLSEFGSMAVICPLTAYDLQTQQFRGLIQPWVDWKNQKGIPTTIYGTNAAGDTYEEVKAFIQSLYDSDPNLTFVQLVGDFIHIPCNVATIYDNTGGMDAFYTLLEGEDSYPDIFVGRFSAESAADLYTQVKRSLDYEKAISSGPWLWRAAGVCSPNPPLPGDDEEYNWDHLDNIRTQLLDFGYLDVARVYGNEGAGSQDLIDCINGGVSLLNYCGEGYPDHWVAPPFWNQDAANLTNTDMLPFIHSVSCWNGQFYDGTCLAEALMRSRDLSGEEARGAIAVYAAAPEQGIAPPMEAQDHAMELLVNGSKRSIGGLCYNGSSSMIDDYGEYGAYNFLAWNLFGDASLVLRTRPATDINAVLPTELPPNYANLNINCGAPNILASLSRDNVFISSCFSDAAGMAHFLIADYPVPGDTFLLTLSGDNWIPIQRYLHCYQYGAHAVLAQLVLDSDQFIEPETDIIKTIRIFNWGTVPAENVTVWLNTGYPSQYLIPLSEYVNVGQILPGEMKETQVSFRIGKGTPDMTSVKYAIWVSPGGFSQEYTDVVHAPRIVLESVKRSPQVNWFNPGDEFSLIYKFRNEGSARLKNLRGTLDYESEYLWVLPPSQAGISIDPGCADSLVFNAAIFSACPTPYVLSNSLLADADNAVKDFWQQWLVSAPGISVESFETGDLTVYPWLRLSEQWRTGNHSRDGQHSLCSQSVSADSIWLELSFYSRQAGKLAFSYDLYRNPDCNDIWKLRLNNVDQPELEDSDHCWIRKSIDVQEGANTIRWVGRRDPSNSTFGSTLCLDMIEFPPRTVFANAQIQADVTQLELSLAPGENNSVPIALTSRDGNYLHYTTQIRRISPAELESFDPEEPIEELEFTDADSLGFSIEIDHNEGEIQDEEVLELIVSANQNLMQSAREIYMLQIFVNARLVHNIPVEVLLNSDPPGFYDVAHLVGYPNPIKESSTFAYSIAEYGAAELAIYNIRGQKVKVLASGAMEKGYYRSSWDARDDTGRKVASGVYFCRLKAPAGLSKTIRCLVIR